MSLGSKPHRGQVKLMGGPVRYFGKIQDHPASFYRTFDIIIAGLDSISARRWINATLVETALDDEHVTPLIDGGTEGERTFRLVGEVLR